MAIPATREDLRDQVVDRFEKLWAEIEKVDDELAELVCVDDWSIRDLLAVRAWWTERVVTTIDALTENDLPDAGRFEWARKWTVSRWFSINTTRQYVTARTYIRRTLRPSR